METELHVAFLWHMHQPSYRDPESGEVIMPWVRLHGGRDYTDMATVMADCEVARATVNWVPGLLDQLAALGAPDAETRDRFWRLSVAAPNTLSDADIHFIRDRFFSLPQTTMLDPWPRYRELHDLVRAGAPLGPQEILDLQTWFNLAWCGATIHAHPEIAAIVLKGRDFTPAERDRVLAIQRATALEVEARWGALARGGRVELSLTPYYHPIIPLLVNTDAARLSDPRSPLPRVPFRFPGDAVRHLRRAIGAERRHFIDTNGLVPIRGMWPSEGSVSDAALPLFKGAGADWIATDEAILARTLARVGREDPLGHLRPWASPDGLTVFFRDHALSDRIGFVYARWHPDAAARDFVHHLQRIRASLAARGSSAGCVVVALDGENCWEHYPGGITAFLPTLYRAIARAPGLTLCTLSEARARLAKQTEPLPSLHPGSWIDGTFRTWLGDPVKNRAWELLAAAREAAADPIEAIAARDPELADLIARAEASDWWWWFGEGHSSPYDLDFDALFRAHLRAIWRRLGRPHPTELDRPVHLGVTMTTPAPEALSAVDHTPPTGLLTVRIDGSSRWYYKWLSAGRVRPRFGAMHRAESLLRELRYCNDASHVHLRLDVGPRTRVEAALGTEARLTLVMRTDVGLVHIPLPTRLAPPEGPHVVITAWGDCLEASIPAELLRDGLTGGRLRGWLEIAQRTPQGQADAPETWLPVERFPADGDLTLVILTPAEGAIAALV